MTENLFGKKIILLNKKEICPLVNTKSDEFFGEIIAMNVILIWKCKKAVLHATSATLHSNYDFLNVKLPNLLLFIKHIVENNLFQE